jgi:methionyl aminopeptidase
MIHIKTDEEVALMRESGKLLAQVLERVKAAVTPGVSLRTLDIIAKEEIEKRGATSSFKGYTGGGNAPPFPGYLCASINDEVVHAPAARDYILKEGDVLSLDLGLIKDGWHADMAETLAVGTVKKEEADLITRTHEGLLRGIEAAIPGKQLSSIGKAVFEYIERHKLGTVTSFVGHGIGKEMHEEPAVPNYPTEKADKIILKPGMVIAIEPMVTLGKPALHIADDGWAAVTNDGSIAAHFERTVAVTKDGPEVLTRLH